MNEKEEKEEVRKKEVRKEEKEKEKEFDKLWKEELGKVRLREKEKDQEEEKEKAFLAYPPAPLNWACPTCAARNALDLFLCACGQTRGIAHSLLLHPPQAPAAAVSPLAVPAVGAAGVFDFGAEGEWPGPRAP